MPAKIIYVEVLNADMEVEADVEIIGASEFSYTVQDCSHLVTTTFVIE